MPAEPMAEHVAGEEPAHGGKQGAGKDVGYAKAAGNVVQPGV
jgi:hypothetical protein